MSSKLIQAILGCMALLAVILVIPRGPRDKGFDNEEARQYFEKAQNARNLEEALKYYDLADKASPHTPMILQELGFTKYNMGMREEGLKDFDRCIELTVDDDAKAIRYSNRAYMHHEMNNKEQACADWKKAGSYGEEMLEKYCR